MRKIFSILFGVVLGLATLWPNSARAKVVAPEPAATESAAASVSASPVSTPAVSPVDITQKSTESLGPLETLLENQKIGPVWPFNPVKYAIRGAVSAGVPANTIVLLLLLPIVTFVIAFSRNVVGIRGFGIFLPAALSVVFVATGPVVGIGLFLVIAAITTVVRVILRRLKVRLQYLPRMSLILWAVVVGVLGVLFLAPVLDFPALSNVSIFAVLILILLAEEFSRVQLGKSAKTAVNLTFETLILSLISYGVLILAPIREFVLLNPEISLIATGFADLVLGKYTGLRVMEYYRFRKLINAK